MQRTLSQLALAMTVLMPKAVAQNFCLPEAVGVPNLNGISMRSGPLWWTSGASTNLTRLDDPRWNGAVSQETNGEVSFRALHRTGSTTDTLLLSWTAKVDENLSAANLTSGSGDQLIVGFKQASGSAIIIHVGLANSSSGLQGDLNGDSFNAYAVNGTTLTPITPPWVGTLGTWTWWDGVSSAQWTFQMAVPIPTGVSGIVDLNRATKQFQMFYAFLVTMPGSVVEYNWGTPTQIRDVGGTITYPDPGQPWGQVAWGTSSNCAGDVKLDANQIGVGNPPINEVRFTYPPTPNSVTNQLTARPQNINDTYSIAAGRIHADFFLSNYGSAITNANFWKKIPPGATSSTNTGPIAPMGGLGLIQPSPLFVVPDADRCMYISDPTICPMPPPGIWDQCILVQLSEVRQATPSPPTPLVFQNQSTYNNMLFRQASTLRHNAQISVVGLPPLADSRTTRDVYLYVETVNLPERTSGDSKSSVTRTRDTLIVARRDTSLKLESGVIRLAQGDRMRIPLRVPLLERGHSAGERFRVVKDAAANGKLTVPEVDAAVPTYRIHAYHATGDSLGKVPILEYQTSFGYWVQHDGEIYGWRHHIEGEHLVQLGPNYYKIEVPNNGRTIITTVIEPLELTRFALSLHAGVSVPYGTFENTHDRGVGVTGDLEYWFSSRLGVAALFGYHKFDGKAAGAAASDLELFHTSAALELRLTTGSPSIVIDAGGGSYRFTPGSTDLGAHAGVGIEFDVGSKVSLGFNGRAHSVSTTGDKTTFYAIQAGGRYKW